MQPVSLLVTEIQKQPRFSGEKNYIHSGHPLKKKKKGMGREGMLILTFPFLPLRPSIWNNIDRTETNKTLYNGYSLTKASMDFYLPGFLHKSSKCKHSCPSSWQVLSHTRRSCGAAGECKMLLNKLLCDPK